MTNWDLKINNDTEILTNNLEQKFNLIKEYKVTNPKEYQQLLEDCKAYDDKTTLKFITTLDNNNWNYESFCKNAGSFELNKYDIFKTMNILMTNSFGEVLHDSEEAEAKTYSKKEAAFKDWLVILNEFIIANENKILIDSQDHESLVDFVFINMIKEATIFEKNFLKKILISNLDHEFLIEQLRIQFPKNYTRNLAINAMITLFNKHLSHNNFDFEDQKVSDARYHNSYLSHQHPSLDNMFVTMEDEEEGDYEY